MPMPNTTSTGTCSGQDASFHFGRTDATSSAIIVRPDHSMWFTDVFVHHGPSNLNVGLDGKAIDSSSSSSELSPSLGPAFIQNLVNEFVDVNCTIPNARQIQ